MARSRLTNPFARLRLAPKLALLLSIAALLPVGIVSWLAVSVVLSNLDRALSEETDRQLQVGLSLVLRHVERIGADAIRLARGGELSAAMDPPRPPPGPENQIEARRPPAVPKIQPQPLAGAASDPAVELANALDRVSGYLPPALVQVFDHAGRPVATAMAGNVVDRFSQLEVATDAVLLGSALDHESPLTLQPVAGTLVVRAAAPILDPSYRLLGAVVVSSPLDGPFADEVKSALGTDVLIFAGDGEKAGGFDPAITTFVDETGARKRWTRLPAELGDRREASSGHGSLLTGETMFGHPYQAGYTWLVDRDHHRVGVFAVAVDRAPLVRAQKAAIRSLIVGAAGALVFVLVLAGLLARRLTGPIARLHRAALAVARGDLDSRIPAGEGDEIGDLGTAFSDMTEALKENRERLAARMREIVAIHDAGRAVSSVIQLERVLRTIVDSVAQVFAVPHCALWLVEVGATGEQTVSIGAARAKPDRRRATLHGDALARPLSPIAAEVAARRAPLRIDRIDDDRTHREIAEAVGVTGSLLATPLESKGNVVGVLIVGRTRADHAFTDADENLLATFADQAATAIENARLYEEVRAFNEELERKVKRRTAELTDINRELGRTISELRETQAQLIHSERMAGLGLLVAGVAHEINSPSAAIAGSVDALGDNVARLTERSRQLTELDVDPGVASAFVALTSEHAPELATRPMRSAVAIRRDARGLEASLADRGLDDSAARTVARRLVEIGAGDPLTRAFGDLVGELTDRLPAAEAAAGAGQLAEYVSDTVFLHRNALTIRNAITRIQRIVGALKRYSHLDQEASFVLADLHEGLEDTLVILDYQLRDITVIKKYGDLPSVWVLVDELNQVWTNLIHNAAAALEGQGEITIETELRGGGVAVRIIDDGPGIPADVLPRIFEPFFTTKAKGEGTGLGLGIVRQIADTHHGEVTCDSRPGRTCFEVWLPLNQPANPPGDTGLDSQYADRRDAHDVGKVSP